MKKMRKVLPAIAMLLVSAVMMSTASFAWFTMNSEVKATGMNITAVAPASLWIAQDVAADATPAWASTMTLVAENTPDAQFAPSKVKTQTDFKAWSFEKLDPASSAKVDINGNAPADATYIDSTSFFKDTFLLKLDSQTGDTAAVSVKVAVSHADATADEIWKALRVAVVVDGTTLTFEFSELNQTGAASLEYTAGQELVTLTAGAAGTTAVVYAWLEGTDADCKNANALNCDLFSIDLSFSIGAVTPPASGT